MKTQGFLLKYPEGKSEINLEGDLPIKNLIVTTWQELKDKRDNGELIPGSLYRITDYQCITTQKNTRSAGHQFDIVLLALSANKLAEEGWAMMHDNIYNVVFNDGTIEKCYVYEYEQGQYNIIRTDNLLGVDVADEGQFDGEEFNAGDYSYDNLINEGLTYNYFQNSNLSAWKVWYCLDNDKSRFAWADDSIDEDVITINSLLGSNGKTYEPANPSVITIDGNERLCFRPTDEPWKNMTILSNNPSIGDNIYSVTIGGTYILGDVVTQIESINSTTNHEGTGLPNGRGVIYRLIDEWNIDYPCDFKNMQMLVPMDSDDNIDIQNPVRAKYCYAFTDNTSGDPKDLSINGHAINIKVKPKLAEKVNSAMYFTPGTLFYTNYNDQHFCIFSNIIVGIANATIFIGRCYAITILDGSVNVILKSCEDICIGYYSRNIMLDTVVGSTFGSYCENIQIANKQNLNYGNGGVELATKDDLN